ncbi:MAG: hypothetical protein QMD36_06465 [Candidatus Aenigmarchaeota archaeon]|nr:hypothetical protein [Candidatus Aenigmarchaeota archaeon]
MSKRTIIPIIILIVLIISISYLFSSSLLTQTIRLGITGFFKSVKEETSLISAINKLIEGEDEFLVKIQENNTCYWIKSTTNETHYILQINEYESPGVCEGFVKNSASIGLDQWLNVFGDTSCLCKGEYILRMEVSGLRIKKR